VKFWPSPITCTEMLAAAAAERRRSCPADVGNYSTANSSKALRALGIQVATGVFQAHMSVEIVNDGPVTILLDSEKVF